MCVDVEAGMRTAALAWESPAKRSVLAPKKLMRSHSSNVYILGSLSFGGNFSKNTPPKLLCVLPAAMTTTARCQTCLMWPAVPAAVVGNKVLRHVIAAGWILPR